MIMQWFLLAFFDLLIFFVSLVIESKIYYSSILQWEYIFFLKNFRNFFFLKTHQKYEYDFFSFFARFLSQKGEIKEFFQTLFLSIFHLQMLKDVIESKLDFVQNRWKTNKFFKSEILHLLSRINSIKLLIFPFW